MTEGTLRPLPTLCEGRIQLREPLPESGPALLDALDEQGNPCVVEVIPEAPSLKDQLHRLARSTHPGLPILLDTVVLDGRFLVAQHPGPGHPLSKALGPSWSPWSVARVARVLSRLCHGLDLLHRDSGGQLPIRLGPADLWLTPEGNLRLRAMGLSHQPEASADEGTRMAEAMRDLVFTLGQLSPDAAAGEFLWLAARCQGADPARSYRSFGEMAEALERPISDKPARVVRDRRASPNLPPVSSPPSRPSRWPAVLVLTFLLSVLAGLTWWMTRPAPRPVLEAAVALGQGRMVEFRALATGQTLSRMPLEEPAGDLAASPDGDLLYATQPQAGRLVLLDVRQARIRGQMVLDSDPRELEITPEGDMLFVVHPQRSILTVVDLQPRRLLPGRLPARSEALVAFDASPVELAFGRHRNGEATSPVLYLASAGNLTLMGLRPTRLLARAQVAEAGALAISPGGRRLFVAHRTRPEVEIRDGLTLELVETWPLRHPAVRLLRAGNNLWALDAQGGIEAVDAAPASMQLPLQTWKAVASGPRSPLLWALGGFPSCVLVLDPSQGEVLATMPVPAGSENLVVVPIGGHPTQPAAGR